MKKSPVGSFARFALGFVAFISVSLGLTVFTVNHVREHEQKNAAAAAMRALVAHQ